MKKLLVLAAAALCACAPRYGVSTARDPFAGTVVQRMHGNMLSSTRSERDWMALDAEAVRGRDSTRWALLVDYRAADALLEIRRGASLLLLVDGERVELAGSSAGGRGEDAFGARERARYPVSGALMERIARAKDVRVRVLGRSYYAERAFGPRNLARFRRFVLPSEEPSSEPASPPPPDSAAPPPAAP